MYGVARFQFLKGPVAAFQGFFLSLSKMHKQKQRERERERGGVEVEIRKVTLAAMYFYDYKYVYVSFGLLGMDYRHSFMYKIVMET